MSPRDVKLLIGTATRDVRNQPMGTFAGTIRPDAPRRNVRGQNSSAQPSRRRLGRRPDSQRQGSFADAEHDKVVTFDDGHEVSRTISSPGLARLLRPAANDREHAEKLLAEIHQGHAVVLVTHPTEVAQISTQEIAQTDPQPESEREAA